MHVGTAARTLEKAGNQDLVVFKNYSADRAYTVAIATEAVKAAFDVHEAVFASVQGRKGCGAYHFAVV